MKMSRKNLKKTAACLFSSFLILTAAMAAGPSAAACGPHGSPSITSVNGIQTVYAADNPGKSASGETAGDASDMTETVKDSSSAEDAAEGASASEIAAEGSSTAGDAAEGGSTAENAAEDGSDAAAAEAVKDSSTAEDTADDSSVAPEGLNPADRETEAENEALEPSPESESGNIPEAENSSDGLTDPSDPVSVPGPASDNPEITEVPDTQAVRTDPLGSADSTEILAERVDSSAILPGDKIIIVCPAYDTALSVNPSSPRISPVSVTVKETSKRQVLTQIPEGTAVLEVESAGSKGIYLKCPKGYLTSSSTGNRLYYAESPENCSIWQFRDGHFLYNLNAAYTSGSNTYRNYYLEYFSGGKSFAIYGKRASDSEAPFKMAFYRMGNSDPEDTLKEDSVYRLPVFQTSDTHGYLANTDGEDPLYLLAYISDKVKDVRGYGDDARKDKAILLDGGDIYQGHTMSNMFDGEPLSAAYQIMDYDAVTIGNHEFDWGIENTVDSDGTMMDHSMGEGDGENLIPVIASNIFHNGEKISFADDYIILQKTAVDEDGNELPVRIGVIGFAEDYSSSILYSNFTGAGYSIDPDFGIANRLAASLEESGACDATILLTHQEAEDAAKGLGKDTVFDLVLGGHTHYNVNGTTSWNLRYMQPASYGNAYTYSELTFRIKDGSPVFEKVVNARYVQVNSNPSRLTSDPDNADDLDPALVDLTDEVLDSLSEIFNEEIGYITESAYRYVYLPESGQRSTTYGNWIADIYRRIVDADIAFVNSGGLRTDMRVDEDEISRTIRRSDINIMFPFDNTIYCYEITGEELLRAFEYSLTSSGKGLLSQVIGIDCYFTDDTVNALVTQDGKAIYVNGEWAEGWKDKTFTVALTNYMATTDRPSEDLHNPFTGWADTSRLISSDRIDNEWAYKVLTAEAGQNGGLLSFDTSPHYINQPYTGPVYTEDSGDSDDPGQGETTDPTDPAAPGQKEDDTPSAPDDSSAGSTTGKSSDPAEDSSTDSTDDSAPDSTDKKGQNGLNTPGQDSSSGQGSGNSKNGSSKNSSSGSTKKPGSGSKTGSSKNGTSKKTSSGSQKGKAPQTGDTNNPLLWETLAVLSALGLTLIVLRYRQKNTEE